MTAMVAPVVLINACGLVLLSTAQRLGRQVERIRLLTGQLGTDAKKDSMIEEQLNRTARRARLLQGSLSAQYVSICFFVLSVFAIAFVALAGRFSWLPVALALAGVVAFLYAAILLIIESREAIASVRREIDFALEARKTASRSS